MLFQNDYMKIKMGISSFHCCFYCYFVRCVWFSVIFLNESGSGTAQRAVRVSLKPRKRYRSCHCSMFFTVHGTRLKIAQSSFAHSHLHSGVNFTKFRKNLESKLMNWSFQRQFSPTCDENTTCIAILDEKRNFRSFKWSWFEHGDVIREIHPPLKRRLPIGRFEKFVSKWPLTVMAWSTPPRTFWQRLEANQVTIHSQIMYLMFVMILSYHVRNISD